jgi:hypothetical protein
MVRLLHQGINPHQQHITALPQEEHHRLKTLSDIEPPGLLQVCDVLDPDGTEGSELRSDVRMPMQAAMISGTAGIGRQSLHGRSLQWRGS